MTSLGIQAASAAAQAAKLDSERQLNLSRAEAQRYSNAINDVQRKFRLREAEALAHYEMNTARDQLAFYDANARKYNHSVGDANSVGRFYDKYSHIYDSRIGHAEERAQGRTKAAAAERSSKAAMKNADSMIAKTTVDGTHKFAKSIASIFIPWIR